MIMKMMMIAIRHQTIFVIIVINVIARNVTFRLFATLYYYDFFK